MNFNNLMDLMKNRKKENIFSNLPLLIRTFNIEDIDLALYIMFGKEDVNIIEERKKRMEQHKLRQIVVARDKKCIITGNHEKQCDTAHIKPEIECSKEEKLDPDNCILLDKSLHKLFDDYFWSINPNTFRIEVTEEVKDDPTFSIYQYRDKKIKLLSEQLKFIKLHYNNFINNMN